MRSLVAAGETARKNEQTYRKKVSESFGGPISDVRPKVDHRPVTKIQFLAPQKETNIIGSKIKKRLEGVQ